MRGLNDTITSVALWWTLSPRFKIENGTFFALLGTFIQFLLAFLFRYVNDGKETALQGNREELSKLETRIQKITNEQETVSKSIAEIQEDVARQQVRTRELEDNIKLHRTQKEMADIQKNINETKKELSKFGDYDNLSRERSSLQKKLDDYRKDKAAYEVCGTKMYI